MGDADVFLTDFGLAKNVATGSKYTRTGETLGTPAYMSPELARGEFAALTPASDTWALGCVLYELLAGRPAFEGETPAAIIAGVLTRTPERPPSVPGPAAALAAVCLVREQDRRPGDAGELAAECARVLSGERPLRRAPRPGVRRAVVAAAILAVCAGGGAWIATRAGPAREAPATAHASKAEALAALAWRLRAEEPLEGAQRLAEAVALAPDRHDWQIRRGLLLWATGNRAAAMAAWATIPESAGEWTESRWLMGFAALTAIEVRAPAERLADARPHLGAAVRGKGRGAALAAAALQMFTGDRHAARRSLQEMAGWDAALLRAITYDARDPAVAPAAIAEYTRALDSGVDFVWVRMNRGSAYNALKQFATAEADFSRGIEAMPRFPLAWVNRGRVRKAQGDHAGALADVRAAIGIDPDDADAHALHGDLLSLAQDWAGARQAFDAAIASNPALAEPYNSRGYIRLQTGDREGARQDFGAALDRDPKHLHARINLANVLTQAGQLDTAERQIAAALRQSPGNPKALLTSAMIAVQRGDRTAALERLDGVLAAEPEEFAALDWRARLRKQAGDLPGALADRSKQIDLRPDSSRCWYNRGIVHRAMQNLPAARADYDQALTLDPHNARAYVNRAALELIARNLPAALSDLQAATTADPKLAPAHSLRAQVLAEMGRYAAAIRAADTYLQLQPAGRVADQIRRMRATCEARLAPGTKK